MMSLLASLTTALVFASDGGSTDASHCDHHSAAVDARGDHSMGFSHEATAHHFALTAAGGTISAQALTAADVSSQAAIRQHMSHIAAAFAGGEFDMPMFVHDTVPPGVEVMKRLRAQIQYTEQATDLGASVSIRTKNPEALEAIHAFLRFQIVEHRTGDNPKVQP